jgi:hypothetical protein
VASEETQHRRLELHWRQPVAAGLAAMSSAVVLSTLGVAGTVIGAAVGSIVLTLGSAVYEHYLQLSRERALRAVQTLGRARRTSGTSPTERPAGVEEQAWRAEASPPVVRPERPKVPWRALLGRLRWQRPLLASAAVFAVVMGAILSFEMTTGRALSSYTGGSQADGPRTSIPLPGVTAADDGTGTEQQPGKPAPADDATGAPTGKQTAGPGGEERSSVAPMEVAPGEEEITEVPPPARTRAPVPGPTAIPTAEPAVPTPTPTVVPTPSSSPVAPSLAEEEPTE